MSKSKLLIMVCLFLVHSRMVATQDSIGTNPLNLNKKVSPIETNQKEAFIQEFNLLTFALGIYYLDTKERMSKKAIRDRLLANDRVWRERFDIDFDLDRIDFKRKGFTRYYPFTTNGRDFIIRIFDIREKHHLPKVEVYYEGIMRDSKIGFQVIPGINTLLEEKKIEKALPLIPAAHSKQP